MVAISVLLIGMLGAVTMIDTGNAMTSRTKAREGATALARSVLEIARGVPYRELSAGQVLAELDDRPGLDDARPGTPGHQVASRGFVYTVAPAVCTVDDPVDSLGDADGDVGLCANSDAPGPGDAAADRNADDYRRIVVNLSWTLAGAPPDSLVQTGTVTNPVGGLGPSVTSLTPKTPATTEIASGLTTSASYDVVTSAVPASITWSVDGARLGEATGSGTTWTFSWPLGAADTPQFVDCPYVVQAEAFDEKGRSGATKALTVTLNRRVPFAPTQLSGGRNLNGAFVDLQWQANQECDVKRYRVYRGTSFGSIDTEVCAPTKDEPSECVDDDAPSGVTLFYQVVGIDTPSGGGVGAEREGDRSAVLEVPPESVNAAPPPTPTGLTVCTGGNPGCNDIDGEPAPSGVPVLSWSPSSDPDGIAFYRVYRDGNGYGDRLDVLFEVPGKPLVFIDATATGGHTYRVSAVDGLFGESALSDEVTW
jgi:hypothetical protein